MRPEAEKALGRFCVSSLANSVQQAHKSLISQRLQVAAGGCWEAFCTRITIPIQRLVLRTFAN
jgi:hypothetical protein